jgi:hypothetical protein
MAAEINCEGVASEQRRCPLSGAKRTWIRDAAMSAMSAYDPSCVKTH